MGFEALRFFNFRNLVDGELPLDAREVFLVGENGQGKTNLLEAIHLLCLGSSFREKREAAFFRDSGAAVGLFGRYEDEASGDCSPFTADGNRPPQGAEGRRQGPRGSTRASLARSVHLLRSTGHGLCCRPPEERRRFFDQTLILSDLSFLDTLRSYRQILKSRNLCLREDRNDLLDVYDLQLAGLGLAIQARRAALVRDFDAAFSPLFQEITGQEESVRIRYRPSWDTLQGAAEVTAHLAAHRERDRRLGTTTTGPHRDSCSYVRAGREYVPYASTGQLRLCALSLRVAQARFLAARTGRKPILLLDDVLLELDPQRKRAFIARFPPYEQAFFTFLPDESWQTYRTEATLVLAVEQGGFRR